MDGQASLFLLFVLWLLLLLLFLLLALGLLLVLGGRLLLTAQLRVLVRVAFVVTLLFLLGLEVLIFTLVLIGRVDDLGLFLLLHVHLHSARLEVLDQGIQFCPFDAQELDDLLFLLEGELDVELLVAGVDAMELDGLDVLDAEVEDGLGDEDERVFEHVEPPRLRLHVGLHAGLTRLRLEVVARLDQVYACSRVQQLHQHLELRAGVFGLELAQLGVPLQGIGGDLGLEVYLDVLLDLDDDVAVDGLPLVDGLVLVELQHDRDLALVGHGQDEAAGDVLVLDRVVEGHPVEADRLGVEVYGVFSPGDGEVDVEEGGQRLSCELADLGPFYDLLVDGLRGSLPFLLLLLLLALLVHGLALLLGLLDVEANLAHAVVVAYLVDCGLDHDVLLVDGGVVDGRVVDAEDGVLAGHRDQRQRRGVLGDAAVVYALE